MSSISDLTPMDNSWDPRLQPDRALGRVLFGSALVAALVWLVVLCTTAIGTNGSAGAPFLEEPAHRGLWAVALTGLGAATVAGCLAYGAMRHGGRAVAAAIGMGVSGAAFVTWIWLFGAFLR